MTKPTLLIVILVTTACAADEPVPLGSAEEESVCVPAEQRLACDGPDDPRRRDVCHAGAHDYVKITVSTASAHQPGVTHGGHARADAAPGASAGDNQGTALDCACQPRTCVPDCLADSFDRPDGTSLGEPWTEIQGDLAIADQTVIMVAGAAQNSWAMADQGVAMDLADARLRFRARFDHGNDWIVVAFNAERDTLAASGLGVMIYGDGDYVQDFVRLYEHGAIRAEAYPAGIETGVDYFVTLATAGGLAALTLATGGYDGPVVHQLGPVAIEGSEMATGLLIGLDHNASPPPHLDEVFLDSAACR